MSEFELTTQGDVRIGPNGGARLTVTKDTGTDVVNLADFYAPNASQKGLIRLIHRNAANTGTSSIDFFKEYQGGFRVINNDTASSNYTSFEVAGSEAMRITSAGNVGIGQSSPSGRLEVNGGYVTLRNGASSFPDGVSAPIIYGSTGGGSGTFNETGNLVLQSRSDAGSYNICMVTGDTPTERVRIDSNGFVGIGTTSPQRKFVVSDAGNEGFEFYPGSSDTGNTLNHYDRGSSAFIDITTNADQHIFGRADGEKMRIDSSGRLLLGNNSSNALTGGFGNALQVEGTSAGTSSIAIIRNSNDANSPYLNFGKSRGTSVGSNTIVGSGDTLAIIDFTGSDGSGNFNSHANIRAHVDGTPGNADSPGKTVVLDHCEWIAKPDGEDAYK